MGRKESNQKTKSNTQTQRKTLIYCMKTHVIESGRGWRLNNHLHHSEYNICSRQRSTATCIPAPSTPSNITIPNYCAWTVSFSCVCLLGIFDIAIHGQRCQYCGSSIPDVGLCLACKNTTCSRWAVVMVGPLLCLVNNCFKWHLLNYWLYFDQFAGVILICPFFDNCLNGSNFWMKA